MSSLVLIPPSRRTSLPASRPPSCSLGRTCFTRHRIAAPTVRLPIDAAVPGPAPAGWRQRLRALLTSALARTDTVHRSYLS